MISCYSRGTQPGRRDMKSIEVGPARHWRHLVHRQGRNLLGGVMVTVMLYAVVLTVLAR
jgi:hypothetical protein